MQKCWGNFQMLWISLISLSILCHFCCRLIPQFAIFFAAWCEMWPCEILHILELNIFYTVSSCRKYECSYLQELGLATSCRWIPKKLPIRVSKSCQKVAIFFKKLLNFQKVAEKLPKFFCFSYLFWVLKIKNSHIASYQNFICQSPMIISEVLSISLDQQIVYQNDMNKTWLYTYFN